MEDGGDVESYSNSPRNEDYDEQQQDARSESDTEYIERNRDDDDARSQHSDTHSQSGDAADSNPSASSNYSGSRAPASFLQEKYSIFVGNLPYGITESELIDAFSFIGAISQVNVVLGSNGQSKGFGFVHFIAPESRNRALLDVRTVQIGSANCTIRCAGFKSKIHFRGCPENCSTAMLQAWIEKNVGPFVDLEYKHGDMSGAAYFTDESTARNAVARLSSAPLTTAGGELLQVTMEMDRAINADRRSVVDAVDDTPPSHKLFLQQLPPNATEQELYDMFIPFGSVSRAQIIAGKRPGSLFAFIDMGDVSQAKAAINTLRGQMVRGVRLNLRFDREPNRVTGIRPSSYAPDHYSAHRESRQEHEYEHTSSRRPHSSAPPPPPQLSPHAHAQSAPYAHPAARSRSNSPKHVPRHRHSELPPAHSHPAAAMPVRHRRSRSRSPHAYDAYAYAAPPPPAEHYHHRSSHRSSRSHEQPPAGYYAPPPDAYYPPPSSMPPSSTAPVEGGHRHRSSRAEYPRHEYYAPDPHHSAYREHSYHHAPPPPPPSQSRGAPPPSDYYYEHDAAPAPSHHHAPPPAYPSVPVPYRKVSGSAPSQPMSAPPFVPVPFDGPRSSTRAPKTGYSAPPPEHQPPASYAHYPPHHAQPSYHAPPPSRQSYPPSHSMPPPRK